MSRFLASIQTQIDNTDSVLEATSVQVEGAVDGLMKEFSEAEIGIEREKVSEVFAAFAQLLRHKRDTLHAAEVRVVGERTDDKAPQSDRDIYAEVLGKGLSRTRNFISDNGTIAQQVAYGFAEPPPRVPDDVAAYASEALHLLQSRPHTFTLYGKTITTDDLIDDLSTPLANLQQALADVRKESRELDLALDNRNTIRQGFEVAYISVVDLFGALFRLAGHPRLAARLRPTQRAVRGDERVVLKDTITNPEDTDVDINDDESGE